MSDGTSDERLRLEIEEIRPTIAELDAETSKLIDEGRKLQQRTRFPPVIIGALVIGVAGPTLLSFAWAVGAPRP